MKKRMIKLMMIFCMAGILTVNPVIIGLAEGMDAVGADVPEDVEESEEELETADEEEVEEAEETLEETEAEEVSETATMSVNEAAVPVVMAAEDEIATQAGEYSITYDFNDGGGHSSTINSNVFDNEFGLKETTIGDGTVYSRSGYDFIGWEKDGTIYQPGYTYTVTSDDKEKKKITFTAVWRQQVTITVDGTAVSLEAEEGATATSVAYKLSETESSLTVPANYEFAKKWVINDNGTPYNATDTVTVKFEDKNKKQIFDTVSVNVDGKTDVDIENNTIDLYSCWNPKNGYYDFRIVNGIADDTLSVTADNDHTAYEYQNTFYIDTLSEKDTVTFSVENKGWSLKKSVSELTKTGEGYSARKDGDPRYYQYYNLNISDVDFKKTVSITYQDIDSSTVFYVPDDNQQEVAYTGSYTKEIDIYAGNEPSWKELLSGSVRPERSDETGNYILGNTWKYRLGEKDADITGNVDFYNNDVHSLTAQPVWLGTCTYKKNYPTSQGGETELKPDICEVGTEIYVPVLDEIAGKYTFEGWLGSDGKIYKIGDSYTIEKANMTFTAQWKAVSYKLKFVDEDGTVYSEGTADFNTQITWPSEPTKEGYTFQNWIVEFDENEWEEVDHGTNFYMYDQDMTFTAQWAINSYKISYDGNGAVMGVPAESVEKDYQTDYTIDTVIPTKTGYTFQGWSDGTTTYQPGATFKVPAKDVVLTAQWKINSHQVKYDGNGGKTSAPESKNADYNSNVSVAAGLEKDGYLFEGWEQISTGKVLAPGASFVMPDMDETLKAKWKIAYSSINGKGTYYLVSGQSYTLASGLKVQGDNSSYSGNMTFYVPQSGYYTFE